MHANCHRGAQHQISEPIEVLNATSTQGWLRQKERQHSGLPAHDWRVLLLLWLSLKVVAFAAGKRELEQDDYIPVSAEDEKIKIRKFNF